MSGVVKSVGKVFKKVGKVAKKVLPFGLAAGALLFTVGGAIGVGGMAGGWGAAVGKLTSSIGMSGTLGNIVAGAVTQAGYGAAIGAATSAVTGGDIEQGALWGAAGGAVTGGISGAAGWQTDPLANSFDGGNTAAGATGPQVTGQNAPAMPAAQNVSFAPGVEAAPASYGGSGLLAKGGWLERNQGLVGGTVQGLTGGLMTGMQGRDDIEGRRELAEQRAGNYRGTGRGLMSGGDRVAADNGANPQVHERTGSRLPTTRFYFNPETSRIEERPA